ncbi:ecto-ADP-ribosyltransferase 5-like [Perca flavescens]|uniref:ecto-ADP-ribosyltransferase 5-like n=1 Tax=Perca flavescens TaxID=8167 RepID=UPI00106E1665|nr:ecto-ADP-ribosyltransferase 5-like [Perca flavescens]XP_028453911.1 ecto-ADP-ribosyltransferase 5-like [Perca flavescens]XP_028453920.1 ecto-ADP-ribosyltransferase 5-like [Perca flavescens]
MPTWDRQTCQRKTVSAFAVTSLVVLVGLLMFVVIYLTLSWQDVIEEHLMQDLTYDLSDDMYDECRSKATVVTDKALMQKWDTSTNFSQPWSNAEKKARDPAHKYMEKHHSVALYLYTNIMLQPVKQDIETAERSRKQLKKTFEPLHFFLSEAIQILKHSQVTCLQTNYRTETLLHLNISNKLIRFNTFTLGSDGSNFTRNASCFEVYTCFGADITLYSALKLNRQVLIPPYEVFKVTDTETNSQRCKVVHRLKSNMNCVYDRESNALHPISALPVDGFWLIFAITCMIIVCLLLPFVIVKVLENHKKTAVYSASSLRDSTYYPPRAVF